MTRACALLYLVGCSAVQFPVGRGDCTITECPTGTALARTPSGVGCQRDDGVLHGWFLVTRQDERALLYFLENGKEVELTACNRGAADLRLSGLGAPSPKIMTWWFPNGQLASHQPADGVAVSYYEDGIIHEIGWNRCDARDGNWLGYYSDGALAYEGNYETRCIRPVPLRERKAPVVFGMNKNGSWRFFRPDGSLCLEVTFENNLRSGAIRLHWPDGSLRLSGSFSGVEPDGEWKEFDAGGQEINAIDCHASCDLPLPYFVLLQQDEYEGVCGEIRAKEAAY